MKEIEIEHWKQANEVYQKLMDLTVSGALSALNEMSELSDEIKGMVLTLISSGSASSQYLNQVLSSPFAMAAVVEFKAGDQLNEYQLDEELGQGGMSKVFKAHRLQESSQKPVAIKVFNRTELSPVLMERFAVEQDILSGLSHPNIINMHHGGTSQEGAPYLVMDLIENSSDIDQYCQAQGLSLKQKVSLIITAGQAVAYAHHNLIVHRDIKPSNLLIDDRGQLKVVDFGIAKLMSKVDAPQKTTILALTPSFAAPEQINSGPISVATDVFSLAVVCLSLMTEDLPLPVDRLLKSCADDETHIWHQLKQHVPDRDLRNILNKALQQAPSKRYSNMDGFVNDLRAWQANRPVQATPDSWSYRITKFAKRRSALFASISTLLVMLVLGITALAWQIEKTKTQAIKANEVKDFMLGVFSVVNPDQSMGEQVMAKDLLAQAVAEIKLQSFADSSTQADLLTAMGTAQLQLGLYQQADQSYKAALAIAPAAIEPALGQLQLQIAAGDIDSAAANLTQLKSLITQDSAHFGELLLAHSKIKSHQSDYQAAQQLAQTAHDYFKTKQQLKGELDAARQLSNIMYLQSYSEQAAVFLEQQLLRGQQHLAPTNSVILGMQNDLVELYNDVGDYQKAQQYTQQLIENIKMVWGEKHPFLIQAYISLAGTSRATGDIEMAKSYANQALQLSTELYGLPHESTARAMNLVAVISYVNGEIELALSQMKEASMLFDQVLGDEHPESWDVKTNLTALLNINHRFDEAIETVQPVLQKQKKVLGESHKSTIYSQSILARLYGDVGRLDEAQALGEDLLIKAISTLGFEHPLTIGGHFTLAKIYQLQGAYKAGIKLLEGVINHESWHEDNERVITAYNTLADLYLDDGQIDQAMHYKDKSLQVAVQLLTESAPRSLSQIIKNAQFYATIGAFEKAQNLVDKATAVMAGDESLNQRFKEPVDQVITTLNAGKSDG